MKKEVFQAIQMAQIIAGEKVVMQGLVEKGLMTKDEYEKTTGEKYLE